ncbi:ROK family protein [Trabulsiella odontotermitis]|uniref:ROK family protein n=1 Tax=Trabulsiella odontotermitis TaxID=379893 RepID=UPI0006767060|nr:ROK family protein [Trabulsiella odontotermitis]
MTRPSITSHKSVGHHILVIDIGGTHVKFGYLKQGLPLSFSHIIATLQLRTRDSISCLVNEIKRVISETGITPDVIVVTVPGFLAKDSDLVLHLPNIPEMSGIRLKTELVRRLNIPVTLERDSVLALMGECSHEPTLQERPVLGIFFGTGIGAAMLINGQPFRGDGWALEIGHMPVFNDSSYGDSGRQLNVEDYASGRALVAIAAKYKQPVDDIFAIRHSDTHLSSELDAFIHHQAQVIESAIALLSPAVVILGGGVVSMKNYPTERLESLLTLGNPFAAGHISQEIRWAKHGWKSVLYGAAIFNR